MSSVNLGYNNTGYVSTNQPGTQIQAIIALGSGYRMAEYDEVVTINNPVYHAIRNSYGEGPGDGLHDLFASLGIDTGLHKKRILLEPEYNSAKFPTNAGTIMMDTHVPGSFEEESFVVGDISNIPVMVDVGPGTGFESSLGNADDVEKSMLSSWSAGDNDSTVWSGTSPTDIFAFSFAGINLTPGMEIDSNISTGGKYARTTICRYAKFSIQTNNPEPVPREVLVYAFFPETKIKRYSHSGYFAGEDQIETRFGLFTRHQIKKRLGETYFRRMEKHLDKLLVGHCVDGCGPYGEAKVLVV